MPYKIEKSGDGYKVVSPNGPKEHHPISHEMAERQLRALYMHANPANEKIGAKKSGRKIGVRKK